MVAVEELHHPGLVSPKPMLLPTLRDTRLSDGAAKLSELMGVMWPFRGPCAGKSRDGDSGVFVWVKLHIMSQLGWTGTVMPF